MDDQNQGTSLPSEEQPTEPIGVLPRTYGIGIVSGSSTSARKMEWPELVGLTAEEAERKIKEEMPGILVQVIQPNCGFTMDFNQRRVRLLVDSTGKVQKAPRIG